MKKENIKHLIYCLDCHAMTNHICGKCLRSNFISKEKVEKMIERMGKKEFAHTPANGNIKHHLPDICRGCQAQMVFLEALSDLRKELLSKEEEQ